MATQPWTGFPHVLESQQFSRESLKEIFLLASQMEFMVSSGNPKILKRKKRKALKKKKTLALFYEPSTRTRVSFEMASHHLGATSLTTDNAGEFSSAIKGETLEDTIKVLCGYRPNVIVLRHYEEGSSARAAKVSRVPIINAGDGAGQHPTQALLDLYTIQKRFSRVDDLIIAMVGDLANGRTVRSLCYLLGKFEGIKLYFVSPPSNQMKDDIKAYLKSHGVSFGEVNDIRNIAYEVDVIYQTRTQKERGSSEVDTSDPALGFFTINQSVVSRMKKHAIVMHPLPRNNELAVEVDDDPRAFYFAQAENGLYIRMALLHMILLGV